MKSLTYTADEVASLFTSSARSIVRMAERKEIPGAEKFGGVWRFSRVQINAELVRRRIMPPVHFLDWLLENNLVNQSDLREAMRKTQGKERQLEPVG